MMSNEFNTKYTDKVVKDSIRLLKEVESSLLNYKHLYHERVGLIKELTIKLARAEAYIDSVGELKGYNEINNK